VKEGAGELTGNHKLEAEAAGAGKETAGKAQDAVHKATR
jgi:uncharacterized protein YjbJ (UPF0337 family)